MPNKANYQGTKLKILQQLNYTYRKECWFCKGQDGNNYIHFVAISYYPLMMLLTRSKPSCYPWDSPGFLCLIPILDSFVTVPEVDEREHETVVGG